MLKQNEFDVLYFIKKNGLFSYRKIAKGCDVSLGTVSNVIDSLRSSGLIDEQGISKAGLSALEPYKVDNAIIMAAGLSSRFVPLSLECPKGLLKIKGEVLIERQIEQLHEAGIKDTVIVLGYKK